MLRRNLAHREASNRGKFDGVFFGAAKLLYDNADRVDENRKSHPLLVAIEKGDQQEVVNQLSGITGKEKVEELFGYVTDFVSISICTYFCLINMFRLHTLTTLRVQCNH